MDIRYFDTLESTNNYCKLLDPKSVGEFTVICAGKQTAGIGQQGNVWVSEPYKNLTFSIILKPSFLALTDQWLLSMTLAVAVSDCLNNVLPKEEVLIKWPNDIYVSNSKICGILVTNQISGGNITQSICGIGLNVNQTEFPGWVPNPTSIKELTHEEHNTSQLLDYLLYCIKTRYEQMKSNPESIKPIYMSRLFRLGEPHTYHYKESEITATITDVDHLGHLHLTTEEATEIVCDLKEIKFVI